MKETIHSEDYLNFNISIYYDVDGESPRDWDNLGCMAMAHKRYNLGDNEYNKIANSCSSIEELVESLEENYGPLLFWRVRMYDHSGISLSISEQCNVETYRYPYNDQWDSGVVGIVFIPLDKVYKEFNVSHVNEEIIEKVYNYLKDEVNIYSQYLNGEVYGYVVKHKNYNIDDSCWGFYDLNNCIQSAKESIELLNAKIEKDLCIQ